MMIARMVMSVMGNHFIYILQVASIEKKNLERNSLKLLKHTSSVHL